MTKRKPNSKPGFLELIRPMNILLCQDVLQGRDGTLSYFKLIDQVKTQSLPAQLSRLVIAIEVQKDDSATNEELLAADPKIKVTLTGPDGKEASLTEVPSVPPHVNNRAWRTNRMILDTPGIRFTKEGLYLFKVFGKTVSSEYELILEKDFPIEVVSAAKKGEVTADLAQVAKSPEPKEKEKPQPAAKSSNKKSAKGRKH